MISVDQTLFHDRDGVGNCFEACIASMLSLKIETVPMFHEKNWFPKFWDWLYKLGYEFHGTMYSLDEILKYSKGIDGYYIVCGESPRGNHIRGGHAVVYKYGKMVHDPHPDKKGLVEVWHGLMIEKKW